AVEFDGGTARSAVPALAKRRHDYRHGAPNEEQQRRGEAATDARLCAYASLGSRHEGDSFVTANAYVKKEENNGG
ncbi:MAG TPA: hypothetical protein VNM48_15705, partial [Chloroflexota bacterium]|nr:hypothetical protein [Chloroflexota bacterium]